jgi:S1-C subfamily serine protease
LGGTIKSVDGLGERSAYGLPDEAGVIVVVAGENSLLTKAGLQDKDVILTAAGKVVPHVNALLELYQAENWTGRLSLTIIRNQQPLAIELLLK